MTGKNIVIAALARDCEVPLRKNIPMIEKLRADIRWSEVVVVENDSKDGTKDALNQWASSSKGVTIISRDYGTQTVPEKSGEIPNPTNSYIRIGKMAAYRNIYMEHIDQIDHPIDLVIMIDLDLEEIDTDSILKIIQNFDEDTGAIFANGTTQMRTPFGMSEVYYDIFAIQEYDQAGEFSYTKRSLGNTFKSINRNIKKKALYPVISGFGGAGVYNYRSVKGLRYELVLNPADPTEAICEHIPFNQKIIEKGYKNYISRDFNVSYGKHSWILMLKQILPISIFELLHPVLNRLKNSLR